MSTRCAMAGLIRGAVCALGLLLAGCGFHLQGAYRLPEGIDTLYVAYSNAYRAGDPPLVDILRRRLRVVGKLGGPDAGATLVIKHVGNGRRVAAISPIDGDAAVFQVRSEVVFDYIVDGTTWLDNGHFAVTRFYSYSDPARLAAAAERRDLRARMHEQLAERILARIKRVTARKIDRS